MSDAADKLDHTQFREQIAAALAGGLSTVEQSAFDAHADACQTCRADLEALRQTEDRMTVMFAAAQPIPGLEDRVIQRLRVGKQTARFRFSAWGRIHPAVSKAVTGVAAAIVLGGFGYFATGLIEEQQAASTPIKVASNLRQIGQAALNYSNDFTDESQRLGYAYNSDRGTTTLGGAIRFRTDFDAEPAARAPSNGPTGGAVGAGGKDLKHLAEAQKLNHNWSMPRQAEAPQSGTRNLYWDADQLRGENADKNGTAAGKPLSAPQFGDGHVSWESNPFKGVNRDNTFGGGTGGAPKDATDGVLLPKDADGDRTAAEHRAPVLAPPVQQPPADESVVAGVPVVLAQKPAETIETGKPVESVKDSRKIIRNGQLEFEVDRFDAAFAQVSKLTTEAGGYLGTTDSEKLPNGKVKGSVIVRVPPDRLDTLVLQLRGIGDLKSQKLEAQDVSKHYSDMDSQLKAARAMEERLIAIIKEGKGQIKDLLAAEKELGNWRTKIEQLVGEMKYYDNLVSLSTLTITLFERDIKTPATAYETETMDAGVETDDVEKARADALKAIEEAKGRVIQSDLKRFDAGQFGATIVAEVPPDQAGQLLDRLKQLGKMARLDVQRKQTSDPNAQTAPLRVEKRDTRLNLSMYNLANVAPRQTTRLDLAADDVEAAYRAILARVVKANGRIVTSNLNQGQPDATSGTISFEVPSAEADAVMNDVKSAGAVMKLVATENPDVQNSTSAKRGVNVALGPIASIPPRESTTLAVEVSDVESAMKAVLSAAEAAKGRVAESNLSKDREGRSTARVAVEVPLSQAETVLKQARDRGAVRAIESGKNLQVPDGAFARARIDITFGNAEAIVSPDRGIWASIRRGFSTSVAGLMWSLQLVVMGICFVLPFALVIGLVWKLLKRRKPSPQM